MTPLERLLVENMGKGWTWSKLSRNPSITPEFVRTHPQWLWSWADLSANKGSVVSSIHRSIFSTTKRRAFVEYWYDPSKPGGSTSKRRLRALFSS